MCGQLEWWDKPSSRSASGFVWVFLLLPLLLLLPGLLHWGLLGLDRRHWKTPLNSLLFPVPIITDDAEEIRMHCLVLRSRREKMYLYELIKQHLREDTNATPNKWQSIPSPRWSVQAHAHLPKSWSRSRSETCYMEALEGLWVPGFCTTVSDFVLLGRHRRGVAGLKILSHLLPSWENPDFIWD